MRGSSRLSLTALVLTCVLALAAACDRGSPEAEPPSASLSSSASALDGIQTTETASDGGTLAIDHGLTVRENVVRGSAFEKSWVVTVHNTSATDMLLFVEYAMVWRYEDGDTERGSARLMAIRPGQEVAAGDSLGGSRRPVALDIEPSRTVWAPLAALVTYGSDAGSTVTDLRLEPPLDDGRVRVEYVLESHYAAQFAGLGLDAVAVLRDDSGRLLGGYRLKETSVGPSVLVSDGIPDEMWLDASYQKSTVSVSSAYVPWPPGVRFNPTPNRT